MNNSIGNNGYVIKHKYMTNIRKEINKFFDLILKLFILNRI